jgi:hypothetical protein
MKIQLSYLILYAIFIPAGLTYAQQNTVNASQDSFPENMYYLANAYLIGMDHMTSQTIENMTHITQSLSVSISIMLVENSKTVNRASAQLNQEVTTQLLPEMKALRKKVIMMDHQVSSHFRSRSGY